MNIDHQFFPELHDLAGTHPYPTLSNSLRPADVEALVLGERDDADVSDYVKYRIDADIDDDDNYLHLDEDVPGMRAIRAFFKPRPSAPQTASESPQQLKTHIHDFSSLTHTSDRGTMVQRPQSPLRRGPNIAQGQVTTPHVVRPIRSQLERRLQSFAGRRCVARPQKPCVSPTSAAERSRPMSAIGVRHGGGSETKVDVASIQRPSSARDAFQHKRYMLNNNSGRDAQYSNQPSLGIYERISPVQPQHPSGKQRPSSARATCHQEADVSVVTDASIYARIQHDVGRRRASTPGSYISNAWPMRERPRSATRKRGPEVGSFASGIHIDSEAIGY